MSKSDVVGRYQLLHLVHQGYLGPLWAARGTVGEVGDMPALVRRFQLPVGVSEGELATITEAAWDSLELSHDNLLKVAEVVFADGVFAIVYDYLEAEVLQALLLMGTVKKTPLSPEVVGSVLLDIVGGLDAVAISAEGLGVSPYRGAVSPESVLVGSDGCSRLIDCMVGGVASALPVVRTSASRIGYCSPEQLRGQPADEQSDVFSLGIMLAELLAGRRYLLGGPAVIEKKILEGNLPPIKGWLKAEGGIVPRLLDVLDKAIQCDRAQRIITLRALVDDFCAALPSPASRAQVGAAVHALAAKQLEVRSRKLSLGSGVRLSDRVGQVRTTRTSRRPSESEVQTPRADVLAATALMPAAPAAQAPKPPPREHAPAAAAAAADVEAPISASSAAIDELLNAPDLPNLKPSDMQSGTHRKVLTTLIGVAPPPRSNIGGPPPLAVPHEVTVKHTGDVQTTGNGSPSARNAATSSGEERASKGAREVAGIADLLLTSVPATREMGVAVAAETAAASLRPASASATAVVPAVAQLASEPTSDRPSVLSQLALYRRLTVVLGATTVLSLTLLLWLLFEGLREMNAAKPPSYAVSEQPPIVAPVTPPPAPIAPPVQAAAGSGSGGASAELAAEEPSQDATSQDSVEKPAPSTATRPRRSAPRKPPTKKVFVPDGI